MSELEEQPLIHEIAEEDATEAPSLQDQLRAQRQEIAEAKDVFLPLTGYENLNVTVRHRLMERQEVEKIGRKILNETRDRGERNMRILLDTIINSTTGFYIQLVPEDDPQPILDPATDTPILTWGQFGHYVGYVPMNGEGDARSALYWIFGSNEFAIGQYGIILNRWMGNTSIKVDEEFLGEML